MMQIRSLIERKGEKSDRGRLLYYYAMTMIIFTSYTERVLVDSLQPCTENFDDFPESIVLNLILSLMHRNMLTTSFVFLSLSSNTRFFTSEIIRATLFCKLGKELPYCCEVVIDEFKEPKPHDKQQLIKIQATICVERDSQKGMVVGKGGAKIKDIGIEARQRLEEFLQEKVCYLFLFHDDLTFLSPD